MPLGMQADSVSVLDQSLSKCLPGTADTVSADGECAARLPWVARLGQAGPAHHLGLISAPWQQPMCRERRISVKHDVIDVLVIEVALSHSFAGILVPSLSFPVSLSFFGPSLCASARGQSAIFHLICKLRHIWGFWLLTWIHSTIARGHFCGCFCFVDFCFDRSHV